PQDPFPMRLFLSACDTIAGMKFQFSLRDLVLIVAIAALAAGWWIDHQRINRMKSQIWEYKSGYWEQNEFDANGDQGWEICGVEFDHSMNNSRVLYKRPK